MTMTDPEKLILLMLCEIHEHLKIESGVDAKFVQSAIHTDNTWALYWKSQGIAFSGEETPPEVAEVVDILEMWTLIEGSYNGLSPEDKENVKTAPFGTRVAFSGFDLNNEGRYFEIARFLVEKLDRFSNFKGRELNSHRALVETYRRMMTAFKLYRSADLLSATQIIEILRAMALPESRELAANAE
jgi:uncharacterized protein YfbU (UPF0304 family)